MAVILIRPRVACCRSSLRSSNPLVDCGAAHANGGASMIGYCLDCGGELALGITTGAEIYLGTYQPYVMVASDLRSLMMQWLSALLWPSGYASLMPPPSRRVKAKDGTPLPVLQRAADALRTMGIQLIRSGGSFAKSIRWKVRTSMQQYLAAATMSLLALGI